MPKFAPETLRISRLSDGDPVKIARIHELMRAQERMGYFRIISMNDDVAVIDFTDHRFAEIMGAQPLGDSHVH
jgi:hypothetical protein